MEQLEYSTVEIWCFNHQNNIGAKLYSVRFLIKSRTISTIIFLSIVTNPDICFYEPSLTTNEKNSATNERLEKITTTVREDGRVSANGVQFIDPLKPLDTILR